MNQTDKTENMNEPLSVLLNEPLNNPLNNPLNVQSDELDIKKHSLAEWLIRQKRVCVAFSSGIDSSLLLDYANSVLKGNVLAVMATGSMVPVRDVREAEEFCSRRGIRLIQIEAGEFFVREFSENRPERCYYCKKNIFAKILEVAEKEGFPVVVEGSNVDDLGDYRPGMKALKELKIQSPLLEARFTKAEIRELARTLGISSWNKPAGACLATRIPFHTKLTPELLKLIEETEGVLWDLGLFGGRVRLHGTIARIELPLDRLMDAVVGDVRQILVEKFKAQGFHHVCLDLEGYVKGSMNRDMDGKKSEVDKQWI